MRFRQSDWDIEMPPPLVEYWRAWNERDLSAVRVHLESAVTDNVEWNDPRDSFLGINALESAVLRLRTTKPEYSFRIASEIDHHNGRLRYRWDMYRGSRTLMEGLDIATLDASSGLINRVDGFFGHPTLVERESSIPVEFR